MIFISSLVSLLYFTFALFELSLLFPDFVMLPKCRNSSEARNHILFAMVPKDHCRSRGMFENTFRGFGKNKAKTLAWRKKPGLAVAGITKKPLDDTSINGRYFNKKRTQDFEVSATQVKLCTRRRYISYAITLPTSQELC